MFNRLAIASVVAVAAGVMSGVGAAAPSAPTLTIRHQFKGCHTWSFNGGPYQASNKISVAKGSALTVVDNDVMPHKLIQTGGPRATLSAPAMSHMAANAKVVFPRKGVYTFVTKAGEDYPFAAGVKTLGKDNVLRLTVVVA